MGTTSMRALIWRSRLADWWANVWRWVLMAGGAVAAVYIVLDQGVANAPMMGDRGRGARHRRGDDVVGAARDRAHRDAGAVHRRARRPGRRRPVGVGCRARRGVRDRRAARPAAVQQAVARAALAEPLLPVHDAVHGDRESLHGEHVEWFHAWLLVSGALVVGWALGRRRAMRGSRCRCSWRRPACSRGSRSCTASSSTRRATSRPSTSRGRSACTRTSSARPWRSPRSSSTSARLGRVDAGLVASRPSGCSIVAILLTQSRQALIGLMFAVVVVVIRRRTTGRSRLVLLLVIPAVWLIVDDGLRPDRLPEPAQLRLPALDWFREVLLFWRESPGVRPRTALLVHRADRAVPATAGRAGGAGIAGVVGLIGFMVMWIGVLVVLWRIDPRFGTLAVAVTAQPASCRRSSTCSGSPRRCRCRS